jgi:hypothetical protein
LDMYWNILTMHGPINVKSPYNTSKLQMGFNSAFKGLKKEKKTSSTRILPGYQRNGLDVNMCVLVERLVN